MVVLKNLKLFRGIKIVGGKCGRVTPSSMPNLEVKPASVDGTVRGTHGRADHCQFRLRKGSLVGRGFLFCKLNACINPGKIFFNDLRKKFNERFYVKEL